VSDGLALNIIVKDVRNEPPKRECVSKYLHEVDKMYWNKHSRSHKDIRQKYLLTKFFRILHPSSSPVTSNTSYSRVPIYTCRHLPVSLSLCHHVTTITSPQLYSTIYNAKSWCNSTRTNIRHISNKWYSWFSCQLLWCQSSDESI